MIGVANWDPDTEDLPFPDWPMRIEPQDGRFAYSPALVIEAPETVQISHLLENDD